LKHVVLHCLLFAAMDHLRKILFPIKNEDRKNPLSVETEDKCENEGKLFWDHFFPKAVNFRKRKFITRLEKKKRENALNLLNHVENDLENWYGNMTEKSFPQQEFTSQKNEKDLIVNKYLYTVLVLYRLENWQSRKNTHEDQRFLESGPPDDLMYRSFSVICSLNFLLICKIGHILNLYKESKESSFSFIFFDQMLGDFLRAIELLTFTLQDIEGNPIYLEEHFSKNNWELFPTFIFTIDDPDLPSQRGSDVVWGLGNTFRKFRVKKTRADVDVAKSVNFWDLG